MEFAVKKCNSKSGIARLATMTLKMCSEGPTTAATSQVFETPFCFQYTDCGTIPHLSWELGSLIKDENSPLIVPLSTTLVMKKAIQSLGGGFAKFANIPKNRSFILTTKDPMRAIKSGYNSKCGISVWTMGGRREINIENYLDIVSIFNPKMFESLCDSDTPVDASLKRVNRSVNRTLSYLDQCVSVNDKVVFASIEGGYNQMKRLESAEETAKRAVHAFAINGFHMNGEDTEKNFDLHSVQKILLETVKLLPAEKPRAMFGAFNPKMVLELINCGIDIFDSSYATLLTEKGNALTFKEGINVSNLSFETISLRDSKFKEDFNVISDSCDCYSCQQNFTKAYINHLLNAKEMLAYVLLNLHNVHSYYEFFRNVRSQISNGV